MPEFTVDLEKVVRSYGSIDIEAENEDKAELKALEAVRAKPDSIFWDEGAPEIDIG